MEFCCFGWERFFVVFEKVILFLFVLGVFGFGFFEVVVDGVGYDEFVFGVKVEGGFELSDVIFI